MNIKHVNRIFACAMLLHVALELLIAFTPILKYIPWNMGVNVFLSESNLWIPVAIGALLTGTNLIKFCNIKKVKWSTIGLTILFTLLIDPLATFTNALSMLVVENTVVSVSDQIVSQSALVMLFFIAVYGPFVEELTFRGVIFQGFRKVGGARVAILLSALLFGLMHMNLNQAGYAFVIGIFLALLCEASGSMLPGFLAHFLFNAKSVVALFVTSKLSTVMQTEVVEASEEILKTENDTMFLLIAVLSTMVVIATPLAICVLISIAKREGRLGNLKALFIKEKETIITKPVENTENSWAYEETQMEEEKKERILTPSLVIGILTCIVIIVIGLL